MTGDQHMKMMTATIMAGPLSRIEPGGVTTLAETKELIRHLLANARQIAVAIQGDAETI